MLCAAVVFPPPLTPAPHVLIVHRAPLLLLHHHDRDARRQVVRLLYLLRILRIARVARVLRLIKYSKGLEP